MRRRAFLIAAVVAALALSTTACAADPTESDEYAALEDEVESLVAELDELAADLEDAESDRRVAEEDRRAAISEAEAAAEEHARAEQHLYDLGESLIDATADLDRAFDLTVLDVADWLGCLDGEMLARMSDDVHALREEIAATADWFDTAAEYDFCETRRAVMRADSAVTSQDDSGLMEVWDRYWDTEVGSDEEFLAYYEFSLRRLLATLERIDDARSAAENAMPEGWQRAEGA